MTATTRDPDRPAPIFVRVSESKIVFGLSRTTIYDMAARGLIRIHKFGTASLLDVAEVSAAIAPDSPTAQRAMPGGLAGGPRKTP